MSVKRQVSVILSLFLLGSCSDRYIKNKEYALVPQIRVLLDQKSEFRIGVKDYYFVQVKDQKVLYKRDLYVKNTKDGIELNKLELPALQVDVIPNDGFIYNGKQYKGNLSIVKDNGNLLIINVVDLESYLLSVVPSEIPYTWGKEVLKAQSIIARTYAVHEMNQTREKNRPFDVYADTRSQVYSGTITEKESTTKGVMDTFGEVLTYKGEVIPTFFHAASGGQTEDAHLVFAGDRKPYLRSVESPFADEVYDKNVWECFYTYDELNQKLKGIIRGDIKNIRVVSRTPSKRIDTIEIVTDKDKVTLPGNKFRILLDPVKMRSTRANIYLSEDGLLIKGTGYGHGVGMGQWDAYGMDKLGYNAKEILGYFYRGTKIENLYN